MNIFRQPREIHSRAGLEAYLAAENGQVPGRLTSIAPDRLMDGEVTPDATPQTVAGYFIKLSGEQGEAITSFQPHGRGIGEEDDVVEQHSLTLGPDQELPLAGLSMVVLSRRDLSPTPQA